MYNTIYNVMFFVLCVVTLVSCSDVFGSLYIICVSPLAFSYFIRILFFAPLHILVTQITPHEYIFGFRYKCLIYTQLTSSAN